MFHNRPSAPRPSAPHSPPSAATPAGTLAERHRDARNLRLEAWALRAKRASIALSAFLFVGVGTSGYLSQVGLKDCADGVCHVKKWHVLSVYPRVEVDVDARTDAYVGLFRQWHSTGNVAFEGMYDEDGHRAGVWREWFADGATRFVGTHEAGRQVGNETWWYPNGSIEWTGGWKDGLRDGPETWYWDDGTLRRAGQFVRGEKVGEFTVYGTEGRVAFVKDHSA